MGFMDAVASESVDGAYFEYDRLNSTNWRVKTSSNSTRTTGSPTTPIAVDTSSHSFRIEVNADGTSVDFFIDDEFYATITTNIPTGSGRETALGFSIIKSAGTTNRIADIDYSFHQFDCSTLR